MHSVIHHITSQHYSSIYAEEYAQQLSTALNSSESLGSFLDNASLQTENYPTSTKLGKQLYQVARLISARDARKAERDFFYVELGGFDTHNDGNTKLSSKFAEMNNALR